MILAGATVDIGCFISESAFCDRFSFFHQLPKIAPGILSFSAELGIREAFGCHDVLRSAISAFREVFLPPKLYTTGIHFDDVDRACEQIADLQSAGLQHIVLRLDDDEARALHPDCVRNLIEACNAAAVVLWLQLELRDTFPEDCLRFARILEDRQFTVTVLPVKIRPVRTVPIDEARSLPGTRRMQLVIDASGEVTLRSQTAEEIVAVELGNANQRSLAELIAPARALN
jgi:hypothetical protein